MFVPDLATLRRRATAKWTAYPEDVLPLFIAESDFGTCPEVLAHIRQCVEQESFGYARLHSDLPEALAGFYQRRYGWGPDPAHVFAVADVVQGLIRAVRYLTREGSAVVVPAPAYPPFLSIPELAGRQLWLAHADAAGHVDMPEIERLFAQGAGSMLVCNPYNPLGFAFSREELEELTQLAHRYGVRLIADEIHAPLSFDAPHIPLGAIDPRAVMVTAASKAWNVAGLKCAQLVCTNEEDAAVLRGLPGFALSEPSILGQSASAACYRADTAFLEQQHEQLRRNRDFVQRELPAAIPGARVNHVEATYLAWVDFTDTAYATKPAEQLLTRAKIALSEGEDFGPGGAGHARLNFATSIELLGQAMERMSATYPG